MSLILDALQKADQDRKHSDSPPSIDAHHQNQSLRSNRNIIFFILSVTVAVLAVAIAVFLFATHEYKLPTEKPSEHSAPTVVSNKNSTQVSTPAAITPAAKTPAQENAIPSPEPLATKEVEQAIPKQPSFETEHTIAKLYEENTLSGKTETNQAVTERQPAQAAPSSQRDANRSGELLEDYSDLDVIKDLPFSVQESIPTLIYSDHIYDISGQSSVILNSKRYVVGSKIDGNISIEKILEDGLILRSGNHRFKMQALNTWLNF